jgi:hypothetical protein
MVRSRRYLADRGRCAILMYRGNDKCATRRLWGLIVHLRADQAPRRAYASTKKLRPESNKGRKSCSRGAIVDF